MLWTADREIKPHANSHASTGGASRSRGERFAFPITDFLMHMDVSSFPILDRLPFWFVRAFFFTQKRFILPHPTYNRLVESQGKEHSNGKKSRTQPGWRPHRE